ncbi:hypothetical protein SPLC1_S533370 [Arthrospira platensis C1]|nr:hypothetical protein SPLC1_S533370 [Arthrospira platensis C1]
MLGFVIFSGVVTTSLSSDLTNELFPHSLTSPRGGGGQNIDNYGEVGEVGGYHS